MFELFLYLFYTPALRTTVLDERDLFKAAGRNPHDYSSEHFTKHFAAGTFSWRAHHKRNKALDIIVHGILQNGKIYSGALLPPHSDTAHAHLANTDESFV